MAIGSVKRLNRTKSVVVGIMIPVLSALQVSHAVAAYEILCEPDVPCIGTKKPNKMVGTDEGDYIEGRASPDRIFGGAGPDRLWPHSQAEPGGGFENVWGGPGRDIIDYRGGDHVDGYGGPGRDKIFVGYESRAYGGPGDDRLVGSSYSQGFTGGPGDDVMEGEALGRRGPSFIWDTYILEESWGHDTIVDVQHQANGVRFQDVTADLEISMFLHLDTPEVRTSDGVSTVDWTNGSIKEIWLGSGDDIVRGNLRTNLIAAHLGGVDTIRARGGTDWVDVYDESGSAFGDTVNCGSGDKDVVWYDVGLDEVINCEKHNPDWEPPWRPS